MSRSNSVELPNVYRDVDSDTMVISVVNMALPSSNPNRLIELVGIVPSSVSESPSSPRTTPYDIQGRSSPPQSYSGGGSRSVSVSLKLHRDLFSQSSEDSTIDYFDQLIRQFKGLNYPIYTDSGIIAPKVFMKIGDSLRISGIPKVDVTYRTPISKKKFMVADISISVTEVLETSWSGEDVVEGTEQYVTWGSEELR